MNIANNKELKIGDEVCYQPQHHSKYENGIVKSIPTHTDQSVFVVYNCGGKWHNFTDYTAALTNIRDLTKGWKYN